MVVNDPIADFLTRIRNANTFYHDKVEAPASKVKKAIANILKDEGFVKDFEYVEDGKQGVIQVTLKYNDKQKVIQGLSRVSKPGLRIYSSCEDMPRVMNGMGIAIVSTPKGIMTDRAARKANVGGEVLAFVW